MPATFFIGDLHFRHELVAGLRGFKDVYSHDTHIMNRWEKQVKSDDLVYVMGDISGGRRNEHIALSLISTLPGRKRVILGNHDSPAGIHKAPSRNLELYAEVFESINDYGRISHNGEEILLCHYPYLESADGPGRGKARYTSFRLPYFGKWLIHAHTHHNHPTNGSETGREICVSWEAWGRLVDMGDISQIIKKAD